jgi:protein-arginine kinase activator protein McsA
MEQNKFNKEDLENLIHTQNKSYREIGKLYGVSDTYIKKIARKLGIELLVRKVFPKDFTPINKGTCEILTCKNCLATFQKKYGNPKFCCHSCSIDYRQKNKYNHYLFNQQEFTNCISDMKWFKKYILEEQNEKCNICNIDNFWNGKPLKFILDHIDGNAANNTRNNLRLICHNCDSQLDTYKSKNKNSARKNRYFLNYKNKL